jgi:hypothetical protein
MRPAGAVTAARDRRGYPEHNIRPHGVASFFKRRSMPGRERIQVLDPFGEIEGD